MFDPNEPIDMDYGILEADVYERFHLAGHSALVCITTWNPVRPLLLSGSADGTIRLWDISPEGRGIANTKPERGLLIASEQEFLRQVNEIVKKCIVLAPSEPSGIASSSFLANLPSVPSNNRSVTNATEATSSEPATKRRKKNDGSSENASTTTTTTTSMSSHSDHALVNANTITKNRAIVCSEWSPAGDTLVVGTFDGNVHIYSIPVSSSSSSTTPKLIHTCTLPESTSTSSSSSTWSSTSSSSSSSSSPHSGHPVSVIRVSPSGQRFLSAGVDGTICIWDISTGTLLHRYTPTPSSSSSSLSSSTSSDIWPSAPVLDADWRDDTIFAVSTSTPSPSLVPPPPTPDALNASSPSSSSSSSSPSPSSAYHRFGRVLIFDTSSPHPSPVARVRACAKGDVNSVRWCPFGRLLATAGDDAVGRVYSFMNYLNITESSGNANLTASGSNLGTSGDEESGDGSGSMNDSDNPQQQKAGGRKKGGNATSTSSSTTTTTTSATTTPITVATIGKKEGEYDKEKEREIYKIKMQNKMYPIVWPKVKEGSVVEIDKAYLLLQGHERAISSLRFNVDKQNLNAALAQHTLQMQSLQHRSNQQASSQELPLYIATSSQDCTVKVWDVIKGRCVMTLSQHIHPVNGIAWSVPPLAASPTVSTIVPPSSSSSSSSSSSPLIPQIGPGRLVQPGGITSGQFLASYSHERVHVWSVAEGSLIKTLRMDSSPSDLAWHGPNQLGIGTADGSVYIMDIRV